MRRDLSSLAEREFDVVVVGGGIFGICATWEAVSRGLSVALIESRDFAHATSANCFKVAHGGIRYLQHGDLPRIRESSRERRALLRIAPHLVHPMPIVVPTYGSGLRSKGFLRTGMGLYDLITGDRNLGISEPGQRIPPARAMSRQDCMDAFPGIDSAGLTGGMLFHDGHIYSPPRLALAFLKSAVEAGAIAANYVKVTQLARDGNRVVGVVAEDSLNGDQVRVRGKVVINATGPWTSSLLTEHNELHGQPSLSFSRDAAIVVKRRLSEKLALAVQGKTRDPDAIMSRGNRHLFMMPWRDYTLLGVWHVVYQGHPEEFTVTEPEVNTFLEEFNQGYHVDPPLSLSDISFINSGLTLFGENRTGAANLSYGKRSLIIDHAPEHGLQGLVTIVGVRYTTARGVAEKAINLVSKKLQRKILKSETAVIPLYGGHSENMGRLTDQVTAQRPHGLDRDVLQSLLRNHGSLYRDVLRYADESPGLAERIAKTNVIKAEVMHAVRDEMAQKLSDVVFRRTDLGTGENPGEEALRTCAYLMGAQLEWDQRRVAEELEEVRAVFPHFSTVRAKSHQ